MADDKNLRQVKEEKPKEMVDKAADYCASLVAADDDNTVACPWCAWVSVVSDTKERSLATHVKTTHRDHVMQTFFNKDLGLDAFDVMQERIRDEEILAHANPSVRRKDKIDMDELDVYDHLWITPEMKKRAENEGGKYRFVTQRKFGQYQAMGAKVVERPRDITPPSQGSTEDTTWKANELVLMYFSPALAAKREKIRRQAVADQTQALYARKEQKEREMSEVEEVVYKYYRDRKMPDANARMLARRLSQQQRASQEPATRRKPADDDAITVISRG